MEDQVQVEAKCPACGKIDKFEVPRSGFDLRSRGANLIKAFPNLPIERIVQLAHHACPDCQLKDHKLMKLRESLKGG